jgi:hypothetical protein
MRQTCKTGLFIDIASGTAIARAASPLRSHSLSGASFVTAGAGGANARVQCAAPVDERPLIEYNLDGLGACRWHTAAFLSKFAATFGHSAIR